MRCRCFSRLNTCCAHRKHWMCGYVKQVSWFITVICHLHWMVLITARTNGSFITASSTPTAVAIFLSLFFFFQLVSGDTNCQLTGQNPQVTWFILTCSGWKYGPAWEELWDFPPKLANKIFRAVSGPSRRALQQLHDRKDSLCSTGHIQVWEVPFSLVLSTKSSYWLCKSNTNLSVQVPVP